MNKSNKSNKSLIRCDVYPFMEKYGGGFYIAPKGFDMNPHKTTLQAGEKSGTYWFDKKFLKKQIGSEVLDGVRIYYAIWQE